MLRRILIFSDSLATPRSADGVTLLAYEEAWPRLLQRMLPGVEIFQVSIGSATAGDILHQVPYWKPFAPDLVLLQLGLNDCLPRALHRHEMEICNKYWFGRYVHRLIGKNPPLFRRLRNINYTSVPAFISTCYRLRSSFTRVHSLSILFNASHPIPAFPRCAERISRFNAVLSGVFEANYLDITDLVAGTYQADNFHIKAAGHRRIAQQLYDLLALEEDSQTAPERPTPVADLREACHGP